MNKNIFKSKKFIVLILLVFLVTGLAHAMEYIPRNNEFSRIANMKYPRSGHYSILLKDGRVLIIGGTTTSGGTVTTTVEIYDPLKKNFYLTDNLKGDIKEGYTATLLQDGKVLITGGVTYVESRKGSGTYLPESISILEVYDPNTNKFSIVAHMKTPRKNHSATLLPTGEVLIVGGENNKGKILRSAELYNPKTNKTRYVANTIYPHSLHSAILTKEGILITGNRNQLIEDLSKKSELYDFLNNKFIPVGELNYARVAPNLILLKNNDVLISGGTLSQQYREMVEMYDHKTQKNYVVGKFKNIRWGYSSVLLKNGKVLFTGGASPGLDIRYLNTAEIFDPNLKTFTKIKNMKDARSSHESTLLNDGKVLITGGWTGKVLKTAEIYNYK
jgi:hypothetical protein